MKRRRLLTPSMTQRCARCVSPVNICFVFLDYVYTAHQGCILRQTVANTLWLLTRR